MKNKSLDNIITKNKRAYFDYEVINTWESWIELKWYETKSVRYGYVNLKWSYIIMIGWELYVKWMHISPWKVLFNRESIETERVRKIFLHKKTILYLISKLKEVWFSVVPLELYFVWNLIKLKIWLVKWKKTYQKKQLLKERTMDKEAKMNMKKYF